MPAAFLPDRSLIRVSGADAMTFLQNLITTDVVSLPPGTARAGALLTPQGKILFDFVIWRDGDGFIIEMDADQQDAFVRRLTMYKLRSQVDFTVLEDAGITVTWGEDTPAYGVEDERFGQAGIRLMRLIGQTEMDLPKGDYDALRTEAGVAVSGADYALQDAFPHDILMDLDGGLSFRKGCYVGQEVVSRMQHRGTARRRIVKIEAEADLPASGTEITAGGKPVGALGTVSGRKGLAIVRTDRVGAALAAGVPLLAGDVPVRATLPVWTGLSYPAGEEADS
ncbi:CAF17-like 4Fe-4S cluster assembly/insertion protein YgfZ [Pseudorhizobium tarimense]|nr:folate-binding protein YgfZ [Pseudorhizobium tarimense]MCJ8519125.1 folate-binding protein YgfZ [Pseudorhizobium tarimense]